MGNYIGKGPYLDLLGINPNTVEPCPFCGSRSLTREFLSIHCNTCGADGPEVNRRAKLMDIVAAWNRRHK